MIPPLTEFFKPPGDPTRLHIMVLLTREGELCVCNLKNTGSE